MPMYNFDVGEEDARWEADLLEDDREQQIALNVCMLMLSLMILFISCWGSGNDISQIVRALLLSYQDSTDK